MAAIHWGVSYPAKSAVLTMTKAAAVEYGPMNVRNNAMEAGLIDAGIIHEALEIMPEHIAELVEKTPISRLGKPEEVAGCVLFLCSEKGAFINGAGLVMDGGYTVL